MAKEYRQISGFDIGIISFLQILKTDYYVQIPGFMRINVITNGICTINRVFGDPEEVSLSGSGGISTEHFELVSWDDAELMNGDTLWRGVAGAGGLRSGSLRSCGGGFLQGAVPERVAGRPESKIFSFWGVGNFRFYAPFERFLIFEECSKLPDLKKSRVWELEKLLKIK